MAAQAGVVSPPSEFSARSAIGVFIHNCNIVWHPMQFLQTVYPLALVQCPDSSTPKWSFSFAASDPLNVKEGALS